MGYSGATTFLTYLNQHGLITFNGPAVMAGFAQTAALPPAFAQHVRTMLMQPFDTYSYPPYGVFTERYRDWNKVQNAGEIHPLQPDPIGPQWVQGTRRATGRLFGGCIEVLEFLKGTRYWPAPAFWDGRILFFETSEETPAPDQVKRWLRSYGIQGVSDRIQGILFGRPCRQPRAGTGIGPDMLFRYTFRE